MSDWMDRPVWDPPERPDPMEAEREPVDPADVPQWEWDEYRRQR